MVREPDTELQLEASSDMRWYPKWFRSEKCKGYKGRGSGLSISQTCKGDPKRAGTTGGFSEYVLIPNAELGKGIYAVPDEISSKEACLIEPFTVGCRADRRSFPQQGENAIVFGAGTIGIAAAIALKYFGCDKVMICDHSDFRLNKAKNWDLKSAIMVKKISEQKRCKYLVVLCRHWEKPVMWIFILMQPEQMEL